MKNFQKASRKGSSTDFIVSIEQTNRAPVFMFRSVAFLKDQRNQGCPLGGRQNTRSERSIKDLHDVLPKTSHRASKNSGGSPSDPGALPLAMPFTYHYTTENLR